MRLVQRPYTRACKQALTLRSAQAEQIKHKKEEQNHLLREIVQSLRKTLVQIETQLMLIELSKAPIRTRTQQRQLKKNKIKQQEVKQKLEKYDAMLWATRPLLRR